MSKYKAVIFDFDDTLVESRQAKWDHHKATAKRFYDIDLSEEQISMHWGKPFNIMIEHLYQGIDTVENVITSLIELESEFHKKLYPETLDVISKILESSLKIGLISAANKVHIVRDLKRLGFPYDEFIIVQGADETEAHKPDPKVFNPVLEILEKENIKRKEIVYIGDSVDDFKAATGAGIDFIGLTTGLYSEEDFKKLGAKVVVPNIKSVLEEII